MKIKTRLKLIIIFIIAILIVTISLNLWLEIQIDRRNNQHELVNKLSFEVFQSNQIRDEYFVYRSERSKQQWFMLSQKIIEQFNEMSAKFTNYDERIGLEKIINLHENISNLFNQLTEYDQDVSNHDATGTEMRERIVSQMMGISYLLYMESLKLSKTIKKKADKQILYSKIFSFITFSLFGLVVIYSSWMMMRRVTYPLLKLKESTMIVAEGNLDHRINIAPSDEIGELAHDFDMMTEKLQSVTVSRDELNKEIQERERAEKKLQESESLLQATGKIAKIGGWEFDVEAQEQVWTEEVYRIHEVDMTYKPTVSQGIEFYAPASRQIIEQAVQHTIEYGEPFDAELEFITAKGNHLWVHAIGEASQKDGKTIKVAGTFQDITARKQAEEKIQASLLEKETMLKEIHHRVKNNLQVISSLLDLQSSYLQDEKAKEMLHNSMDRIKTMAKIHTMLYQSKDMARVDFGSFIRDLAGRLQQSYGIAASPIQVHADIADVSLTIETSIPCGLILNELVSNALKHAFPEGRGGEVNISMATTGDQFILNVSDNGVGFPEGVDFRNTKSLGLELVNLLVGQINGTITMTVEGGTTFTITFPAVRKGG